MASNLVHRAYTSRGDRITKLFRSRRFKQTKSIRWYPVSIVHGPIPSVPGCYAFLIDGKVVYVGSSNNLALRMRAHRNCGKFPIESIELRIRPSKKYGDWAMIELRLIRRLKPVFNSKHKGYSNA